VLADEEPLEIRVNMLKKTRTWDTIIPGTQLPQGRHAKIFGFPQSMMKVTYKISDFRREVDENCNLIAFTQRTVAIPYRRFGTTYRSHLQGSRIKQESSLNFFTFEDGTYRSSRNVGKKLPLHSQKSAVLFFR
jgi:hypothetical protein